jgi:hypothetical protein
MKNINHETTKLQEMKKNIIQNERYECETLPVWKFTSYIGSEELTVVTVKYTLFWDVTPIQCHIPENYSFHQMFFCRKMDFTMILRKAVNEGYLTPSQ